MKKITLLFSLLISLAVFSQCIINGNSTIKSGEIENYTVEVDVAQCKDCHLWTTNGGNVSIESDPKQNTIKLKGNSAGRTVLSLLMLAPKGMVQCSKNIEVNDPKMASSSSSSSNIASNCDIDSSDYKELKYSDGIVTFFPANSENDYKYEWTANYVNGEQKHSTQKVPQFSYSKENGITAVSGKIVSAKCMRSFTKAYDSDYWKFF